MTKPLLQTHAAESMCQKVRQRNFRKSNRENDATSGFACIPRAFSGTILNIQQLRNVGRIIILIVQCSTRLSQIFTQRGARMRSGCEKTEDGGRAENFAGPKQGRRKSGMVGAVGESLCLQCHGAMPGIRLLLWPAKTTIP